MLEQAYTPKDALPIQLAQQLGALDANQLAWISGYSWALSQHRSGLNGQADALAVLSTATQPLAAVAQEPAEKRRILILSCSQTGNAQAMAQALHEQLQGVNAELSLATASDYRSRQLVDEDIVLLVTSTQGEGEPPEEAVPLYKFLFHKKAPDLSKVSFAVLGLGDSSYPKFNQAAKDFDEQFEKLGATRLFDRTDCDLDYKAQAEEWIQQSVAGVNELLAKEAPSSIADPSAITATATGTAVPASAVYTKDNPYEAELITKQRITTEEANEVLHFEIDLADSGIQYEAGDSLGVYFDNSPRLVEEILEHSQVAADAPVKLTDGRQVTISEALTQHLDITTTTPQFVQAYAEHVAAAGDRSLADEIADPASLNAYLENRPPVFVMADHPVALEAQTLCGLFRPLSARFYSIASAQEEVGDEVHITVRTVRYSRDDKDYEGAASGFLADRIEEGDNLRIFVEPNRHFRLPENGDAPIIMIGAGTGIAPFRAFVQARQANDQQGKNWLFFGNQRFTEDFLYQTEWIQLHQAGFLPNYDFAWSRQGDKKEYVQHKLAQRAPEVWQWLQAGAHIYVCGDANRMAKDVEATLLNIISEQGGMSLDDAEDYLSELREDKRYQRDVY